MAPGCKRAASNQRPLVGGERIQVRLVAVNRLVIHHFRELDAQGVKPSIRICIQNRDFLGAIQRHCHIDIGVIEAIGFGISGIAAVQPEEFIGIPVIVVIGIAEEGVRQRLADIAFRRIPGSWRVSAAAVPDLAAGRIKGHLASPDVFAWVPDAVVIAVTEEEHSRSCGRGGDIVVGSAVGHAGMDDARSHRVSGQHIVGDD